MNSVILLLALGCLPQVPAPVQQTTVLVEAESFSDVGGWVVDLQFMDIMGSPYLWLLRRPTSPCPSAEHIAFGSAPKTGWPAGTHRVPRGVEIEGNTSPAWSTQFSAVKTRRLRLVVTKTQIDVSRIWEVEFYGPVGENK